MNPHGGDRVKETGWPGVKIDGRADTSVIALLQSHATDSSVSGLSKCVLR